MLLLFDIVISCMLYIYYLYSVGSKFTTDENNTVIIKNSTTTTILCNIAYDTLSFQAVHLG